MNRAPRLREALHLAPNEAALLHNPSNMFYVSGYTGEGAVLVCADSQAVITDFRYTEQAENEASGFAVEMTRKGRTENDVLAELVAGRKLDTLYFEDAYVTVRTLESLKSALPKVRFLSIHGACEELRQIKDEDEISRIAAACQVTSDAFEHVLGVIKDGMTERDIALELEFYMFHHGAQSTSFSTIVAAGAHGSLPHAQPGDRKIQRGDMITMDFGARVSGYCADMTRTVAFGQPSDEMKRVYDTVYRAQLDSQDALMAGKVCKDIDAVARSYIDSQGYEGRFGHGLGHSLGIDIHENPRLSLLCEEKTLPMQVLTVEPGVYLPGIGGVRIENTCVVLEGGCRALTPASRELIIL